MNRIKCILLLTVMMVCNTFAQKLFTLDDLLGGGNNFWNLQPENKQITWWGDQALETHPEKVTDLLTGKELFTTDEVNQWAKETVVRNGHYLTFPYADQSLLLAQTPQKRILVDFKAHRVVWQQAIPAQAQHQDWNATSRHLAYTVQGNLYILTAQGETLVISTDGSTDGSENIVYGQSVHREEFGIYKGTFWSPDGQKLAFYRMDQSMVPNYPQVDINSRIASTYADHYPMAGETSHQVTVGVYDVPSKKVTWLPLVGEKDDYHTNLSWAPDNKTLYIFELNRAQNDMRLVAYDTENTAGPRTILQETSKKYVEPQHPLSFLPWDSSKALMQSQKDGYNHLYLLDFKSNSVPTITPITQGNWVVQDLVGFNKKQKSVIYYSNESDPREKCLYQVSLKNGKKTRLGTAEGGVHSAQLNHSGTALVDRYSTPTVARKIQLVSTTQNKVQEILTAADPWVEQGYQIPEITSGSILAADDKTPLYYRMVKPTNFDPTKKYPTVVYVYGGPHAHNVQASWHWGLRGWEAYMAQQGYLLFILDNRGSEWRGLEFEQATWHQLGVVEMQDQIKGVEYLKSLPYVDASRMGVHGWSFGGFMTSSLMCTYPDVFKVGVAGGPVIDWKYYEVMYGERYMGTPQNNPEGYKRTSLLGKAGNLKGRLQVIHGYNDPTCVMQHPLSFVRACIDADTQPDLFVYPGDGHNMAGKDQIHLHERITRYFNDYLK